MIAIFSILCSSSPASLRSQSRISRQTIHTNTARNTITNDNRWATVGTCEFDIIEGNVAADGIGRADELGYLATVLPRAAASEILEADIHHVYSGGILGTG